MDCLSQKRSIAGSMDAFIAEQKVVIERQQEQLAKLQPSGGVQAVGTKVEGSTGAAVDSSDPVAQWDALVEEQKSGTGGSKNVSNAEAIARAAEQNPEVHKAMLVAHNERHAAMVHAQRQAAVAV